LRRLVLPRVPAHSWPIETKHIVALTHQLRLFAPNLQWVVLSQQIFPLAN
jgi:hypothetical protein